MRSQWVKLFYRIILSSRFSLLMLWLNTLQQVNTLITYPFYYQRVQHYKMYNKTFATLGTNVAPYLEMCVEMYFG